MSPPLPSDSISTGELGRRLDTLISEQRDFRGEVNNRFTALDTAFVRKDLFDAAMTRLAKLENNVAWVARTVGGAAIIAIIGGLVAARGLGGL